MKIMRELGLRWFKLGQIAEKGPKSWNTYCAIEIGEAVKVLPDHPANVKELTAATGSSLRTQGISRKTKVDTKNKLAA